MLLKRQGLKECFIGISWLKSCVRHLIFFMVVYFILWGEWSFYAENKNLHSFSIIVVNRDFNLYNEIILINFHCFLKLLLELLDTMMVQDNADTTQEEASCRFSLSLTGWSSASRCSWLSRTDFAVGNDRTVKYWGTLMCSWMWSDLSPVLLVKLECSGS